MTLTYSQECLPTGQILVPRDLELFWKKFRKVLAPALVRYYAVGEYGDQTLRPHYHAIVFGYGSCRNGRTIQMGKCCLNCELVRKIWGKGNIELAPNERKTMQYVCSYVTKKALSSITENCTDLGQKEFTRQSKGIGKAFVKPLADSLRESGELIFEEGVGRQIRIEGKLMPVHRYLYKKAIEEIGFDYKEFREEVGKRKTAQLRRVYGDLRMASLPELAKLSIEEDEAKVKAIQVETRLKNKRRLL